jgi:hypothetical protein
LASSIVLLHCRPNLLGLAFCCNLASSIVLLHSVWIAAMTTDVVIWHQVLFFYITQNRHEFPADVVIWHQVLFFYIMDYRDYFFFAVVIWHQVLFFYIKTSEVFKLLLL